jgi:hypothetical protein
MASIEARMVASATGLPLKLKVPQIPHMMFISAGVRNM